MRARASVLAVGVAGAVVLFISLTRGERVADGQALGVAQATQGDQMPRFTADGQLVRPPNWERWVMVGSSIGLSYNEPRRTPAPGEAPGMFHNIYMQPWAYDYFMERGEFAEGTMFAMAMYEASRNADPARNGFYEGDPVPGIEVHVKRAGIDSTGWGFFNFGAEGETAAMIPGQAACYSCHAANAAFDQVFTQFYPPLRARLGRTDAAAGGGH